MRKHRGQLETSVEASGPHDFAVRAGAARLAAPVRPSHPRPTFVTIAKRPFVRAETARLMPLILADSEANYFCGEGWTGISVICPSGKSGGRSCPAFAHSEANA